MTEASTQSAGAEGSYELNYELDGSSFTVRENLLDILERELLGPIGGPEEVLPFSPRSQYLVGHIAPVKLGGRRSRPRIGRPAGTSAVTCVEVRTDDDGSAEGRGVPAYAADETEADVRGRRRGGPCAEAGSDDPGVDGAAVPGPGGS